ncbi:hypothetical protein COY14_00065 [Candidatus Roizmanbacteria bacterium CG_4_10_14_0_2_um_filter_36_9]|uniref:Uncharacterized protein n=1 Tax=Candidatus Roizmanbacteria bacterium CG_4_10_14_0_2_um_filter_36_9 TaxID=1974823 RepID=A0A2M7U680_9BACT|nr:MAG: hypothetical protein COY14_00065 [Candidatus Roizmanbacteria bacterium CG_4_10_14_0_2_um_filter_36_9]
MKIYSEKKQYTIDLAQSMIPSLLTFLGHNNINYSEISIDKPDLEDYFLKVASNRKSMEL